MHVEHETLERKATGKEVEESVVIVGVEVEEEEEEWEVKQDNEEGQEEEEVAKMTE